jgi:excisionase family DNA binding protein
VSPKRLVGLRELSAELGIPYGTLYDLVKRGELPAVNLPGVRRILVDRKDLERCLEIWKKDR